MVGSPSVRKFRAEIINSIPRVPNTKASRSYMESQPTSWLISTFVTWRQRQIPAKPRRISLWSGGITPSDFASAKSRLRGLLQKVETGEDLTPHLSYLVDTKGVILPVAKPAEKGIQAVIPRNASVRYLPSVWPTPPGRRNTRSALRLISMWHGILVLHRKPIQTYLKFSDQPI